VLHTTTFLIDHPAFHLFGILRLQFSFQNSASVWGAAVCWKRRFTFLALGWPTNTLQNLLIRN
jgi:hypothetical protein